MIAACISTPAAILIFIIEIFVLGAIIVRGVANLRIDQAENKKGYQPVKFDQIPPQRFIDQWIATQIPPINDRASKQDIAPLLILLLAAIVVIYIIFIIFFG